MKLRSFKCLQKGTEIEHKLRSFNRRILELEHIKQVKSLAALSSARTLVSQLAVNSKQLMLKAKTEELHLVIKETKS